MNERQANCAHDFTCGSQRAPGWFTICGKCGLEREYEGKVTMNIVKPLDWRKPTDHPQDHGVAVFVADGIGGRYSIVQDSGETLLWWAHDGFVWEKCKDVKEVKAKAEADWQKRMADLISPGQPTDNDWIKVSDRLPELVDQGMSSVVEVIRQGADCDEEGKALQVRLFGRLFGKKWLYSENLSVPLDTAFWYTTHWRPLPKFPEPLPF
jgi:hypothetical protein